MFIIRRANCICQHSKHGCLNCLVNRCIMRIMCPDDRCLACLWSSVRIAMSMLRKLAASGSICLVAILWYAYWLTVGRTVRFLLGSLWIYWLDAGLVVQLRTFSPLVSFKTLHMSFAILSCSENQRDQQCYCNDQFFLTCRPAKRHQLSGSHY